MPFLVGDAFTGLQAFELGMVSAESGGGRGMRSVEVGLLAKLRGTD
jgi:hypothetical protein